MQKISENVRSSTFSSWGSFSYRLTLSFSSFWCGHLVQNILNSECFEIVLNTNTIIHSVFTHLIHYQFNHCIDRDLQPDIMKAVLCVWVCELLNDIYRVSESNSFMVRCDNKEGCSMKKKKKGPDRSNSHQHQPSTFTHS